MANSQVLPCPGLEIDHRGLPVASISCTISPDFSGNPARIPYRIFTMLRYVREKSLKSYLVAISKTREIGLNCGEHRATSQLQIEPEPLPQARLSCGNPHRQC